MDVFRTEDGPVCGSLHRGPLAQAPSVYSRQPSSSLPSSFPRISNLREPVHGLSIDAMIHGAMDKRTNSVTRRRPPSSSSSSSSSSPRRRRHHGHQPSNPHIAVVVAVVLLVSGLVPQLARSWLRRLLGRGREVTVRCHLNTRACVCYQLYLSCYMQSSPKLSCFCPDPAPVRRRGCPFSFHTRVWVQCETCRIGHGFSLTFSRSCLFFSIRRFLSFPPGPARFCPPAVAMLPPRFTRMNG